MSNPAAWKGVSEPASTDCSAGMKDGNLKSHHFSNEAMASPSLAASQHLPFGIHSCRDVRISFADLCCVFQYFGHSQSTSLG